MRYKEIEPADDAKPYVECLWIFRSESLAKDAPKHVIVPDGAVSITFFLPSPEECHAGLTGPSGQAHQVNLTSDTVHAGIRLRPGAAGSVLRTDIRTFRDVIGPLAVPLPLAVQNAQTALRSRTRGSGLEAALQSAAQAVVEAAGPLDAPVCAFAMDIAKAGGDIGLGALAEKSALGPRQLRRRFLYQCGLTPKEFARLRRVRQTCMELVQSQTVQLAEAALTAGFADQAHMTREFQDVFRNSTSLVRAYLRQIMHESLVAHR